MENQTENRSLNPGLTKPFGELASQINQAIPRKPVSNVPQPQRPEDPIIIKLKKWLLIILSILVAGGAVILILRSLILKFL